MPRIWLPLGKAPTRQPLDEREVLKQRLYELHYLVPDADTLELSHLRDITQAVEEKKRKQDEVEHMKVKAAQSYLEGMDPEQRRLALKEFTAWRRQKKRAAGVAP